MAVGYAIRKCQEKNFFERMFRNMNVFGLRVKKEFHNGLDILENEAEYIGDQVDQDRHKKDKGDNDVLNEISY